MILSFLDFGGLYEAKKNESPKGSVKKEKCETLLEKV
jgi:hypothetical protein